MIIFCIVHHLEYHRASPCGLSAKSPNEMLLMVIAIITQKLLLIYQNSHVINCNISDTIIMFF